MLVQCELTIDTETLQKAAPLLTQICQVMSMYRCPITACRAAAQWGNRSHGLLLSLLAPWFLFKSSSGAEEALILNHLFRSCFSPCQGVWRGIFISFWSCCWGSCIESFLAPPRSVAGGIAQVYGSLPRFPETGSLLLSCEMQKPGVPRQCQTSRSLLSSLLRPRGNRLV